MAENKRFKYYKNDSTGQEFTIDNYRTGEFNDNELLSVNESIDLLNELNDENKQLEQFKNTVFDLIDKEIKETKEIFEEGKIDLMTYNASMITLTGLKEQLKGDDGND